MHIITTLYPPGGGFYHRFQDFQFYQSNDFGQHAAVKVIPFHSILEAQYAAAAAAAATFNRGIPARTIYLALSTDAL